VILKKVDHLKGPQAAANSEEAQPSALVDDARLSSGDPHDIQTLPPGTTFQGRYEIARVIGIGGMSIVYLANDRRFPGASRPCAVKEMFCTVPEPRARELSLLTFEREASFLAALNHPAIPKVFDYFTERGRVYLVLEYVDGQDFEKLLQDSRGPLPAAVVIDLAKQICDVLSYIHNLDRPVIFRDLKPSNIMRTTSGRAVLIDFGIARTLQPDNKGTVVGTEGYAPPEQYRGIAEPRGDIYSLGATMHHLLTNSDPRTETPFTFQERIIHKFNPNVWPGLETVIMKALAYEPAGRYRSAADMKEALIQAEVNRNVIPGAGRTSGPPSIASPKTKPLTGSLRSAEDDRCAWTFSCGDELRASPLVSGGMIFVGCYDNHFYAVNISDGTIAWKQMTKSGICSSAAFSNDAVFVGSEDGKLYRLDSQTGEPLWTYTTAMPVRSSPRVAGGRVVFGSDDRFVYCLDEQRGGLVWKYRTWLHVRSSPYVWNDRVFIGSGDGYLYCLDAATGQLLWKYQTMRDVVSSPIVHNGVAYVGSKDGHLYALDVESSWAHWKYKTGHQIVGSPVITDNQVIIGSADSNLYSIDVNSSELQWRFPAGGQITSSARLVGDQVLFGCADGFVYSLSLSDGELIWKFRTGGPIVSSPAADGNMAYIGSTDGRIYALRLE
jgi:eukaryotic-like serine/threonine-protein kinase